MRCVQTAPNGVVGRDTLFHFSQTDNRVEAHYAGGRITTGYLVGLVEGVELRFRYCQISDQLRIDSGESRCRVESTGDGRLRIIESFTWESQAGSGVNIFEEIG
jgi:hypothetical protein